MNRTRLIATLAVFASFAAPAFSASLTEDPIYGQQCAKCHGKDGTGRHFGGPSLATSSMSLDDLKAIITNGKGRMPKFTEKLTKDQIDALSAEIKDFSKNPAQK